LERGGHASLRLARGVIAGGDFAARLVEFGFHVVGQLKLIFEKIINPCANLFDFSARQSRKRRFNFLNCAHGGKIPDGRPFAKRVFLIRSKTGVDPKDLRRVSGHLSQIQADIAAAKAEYAGRRRRAEGS
jgi:hypothetical protein